MKYDELVSRLLFQQRYTRGLVPVTMQEAADAITTLQAEHEQCRKDSEWQPIETAPKDETVLVSGGTWSLPMEWKDQQMDFVCTAVFHRGEWLGEETRDGNQYSLKPTHWKPLPKPPVTDAAIDKAMESV